MLIVQRLAHIPPRLIVFFPPDQRETGAAQNAHHHHSHHPPPTLSGLVWHACPHACTCQLIGSPPKLQARAASRGFFQKTSELGNRSGPDFGRLPILSSPGVREPPEGGGGWAVEVMRIGLMVAAQKNALSVQVLGWGAGPEWGCQVQARNAHRARKIASLPFC